MCLCVVILVFSLIWMKCHLSVTMDFIIFVVEACQKLLKSIHTWSLKVLSMLYLDYTLIRVLHFVLFPIVKYLLSKRLSWASLRSLLIVTICIVNTSVFFLWRFLFTEWIFGEVCHIYVIHCNLKESVFSEISWLALCHIPISRVFKYFRILERYK